MAEHTVSEYGMARSWKYLQVGLGVGELEKELKGTYNPEEWILFSGEHEPEELHDVIDCVVGMAPWAHEDTSEAGDVPRGRCIGVSCPKKKKKWGHQVEVCAEIYL